MLSVCRASTNIESKRQFRLMRPVGSGARRRRWGVTEAPAHSRRLSHTAINHDLHRATRTVRTSQEDALLELDRIGQGGEGPQFAILQQKHDATAVRQAARLDRGMEMESNGEFVAATQCPATRRGKAVLAIVRTGNNRAAAKQPSDYTGLKEVARRAIIENNSRVRRGGARDLPPILLVH